MLTLLEQAKYTRVFAEAMFVGFLAHTRAPRVVFLTQDQNMFFEFSQSLRRSPILGLAL